MKYVFLAAFALFSAVHLKDSYMQDKKKRAKTKPFLLFFLLLFYVFASQKPALYLCLALFTSWLGDVLLIPEGNAWFISGGISFLLAHVFFILLYSSGVSFEGQCWPLIAAVAAALAAAATAVTLSIRKRIPKAMKAPMYLYLLCNGCMNVFALMQLWTRRSAGSAMAFAGALLFFASDCTLYLVRYHEDPDVIFKRHFTVMLTYLLGELLITLGTLAELG